MCAGSNPALRTSHALHSGREGGNMHLKIVTLLEINDNMITPMKTTPYRKEDDSEDDELENLIEQIDNKVSSRLMSNVKNIVTYPFKRLKQRKFEGYLKELTECDGFRKFEERLKSYTTVSEDYKSIRNYISTLLMLDHLDSSLKMTKIELPNKINALDVGCGRDWYYAKALYDFLQNYDSKKQREVTLDGIDPLMTKKDIAKLKKRIEGKNINSIRGNVLEMSHSNHYDFILMHKMLTSPVHFRRFGLEPTDLNDVMEKCSTLLTSGGVQVTIGYQSAGEYWHVVEHIPIERRKAEFNYRVELGNESLNRIFTPGIDRFYLSGICISRK